MDCKTFISKHAAFLDDTLPGVDMTVMRDHLSACSRCARKDANVRRALFLVRNLPPVRVSDGFQERLRARLDTEAKAPISRPTHTAVGVMKWAVAAALVIAVAGVAARSGAERNDLAPLRLPAVIASSPDLSADAADDSAPAYVASMSTGIPMWPALMLAEEGPLRFATAELHSTSWEASRPH